MADMELVALIADYLDARAAFIAADKDVDELHKRIKVVASAVGDPLTTNGRVRSESVQNFDVWLAGYPSPDEIRQVMADWEVKRRGAAAAHFAIPADRRTGIVDLPLSARH